MDELPGSASSLPHQLISDWIKVPRAVRGKTVMFPTYPPSPLSSYMAARTIFTLHDLTWWKYPESSSSGGKHYYRKLAERALLCADVIVTHTEAVASELRDSGLVQSQKRIEVVSPAPMTLLKDGQFSAPRPYILAVGTQEPRKNLVALVEAYNRSGLTKEVDLCIIGRTAWGRVSPVPGVRLVTKATDAELSGAYKGALGLIAPSLYEGFGLPLIEASLAGIPVACSDIPVFHEVTSGYAEFFDPNDVEDMQRALMWLAAGGRQNPSALACAQSFSWDRAAASVASLLAP
ncbi:glycosyltransferase family 1 protein [Roseibium sp.]|uniref:glycosyltransferase family 4 protein n=1 Tax=Roseibium sp. TaxID=1936156 RepID=UPI003299165F